ncbi:hypothetical protein DPMN_192393 [Dreissena polymorpha]|uniref:Uncharacterized protein n=1 Tax=Dreissena polymorpha TaxID=45954 RepID=A0A9D3Y095_DREPO|nr:hypothetical protein DPMN_192393 [Dreissena polymorpha]
MKPHTYVRNMIIRHAPCVDPNCNRNALEIQIIRRVVRKPLSDSPLTARKMLQELFRSDLCMKIPVDTEFPISPMMQTIGMIKSCTYFVIGCKSRSLVVSFIFGIA